MMKDIRRTICCFAALVTVSCLADGEQAISLADARGKIGEAIADVSKISDIMDKLSADDQVAFLGDANLAISKMPASTEEMSAKFLDVDRAALKSAKKGNVPALLAEIFATATPEALTVLNERFAEELFNRKADTKHPYTDEQFVEIATNTLKKIAERNAGNDDAGVRNTFAALMLMRASGGTPENLADILVDAMPGSPDLKELVRTEWIPSAMGIDGHDKTYEPMLAAVDANHAPSIPLTLRLAGPRLDEALLADLSTGMRSPDGTVLYDYRDVVLASDEPGVPFDNIDIRPHNYEEPRPYQWNGGWQSQHSHGGQPGESGSCHCGIFLKKR